MFSTPSKHKNKRKNGKIITRCPVCGTVHQVDRVEAIRGGILSPEEANIFCPACTADRLRHIAEINQRLEDVRAISAYYHYPELLVRANLLEAMQRGYPFERCVLLVRIAYSRVFDNPERFPLETVASSFGVSPEELKVLCTTPEYSNLRNVISDFHDADSTAHK